jgi:saccharopine dehydrogenase (NAD+, L-lysine-forming)
MNILVIGAGGVGASMASIAETRSFFSEFVLADLFLSTAQKAIAELDDPSRFRALQLDARDKKAIVDAIAATKADIVVNACDPRLNENIFDACFEAGTNYLDMAMNLSKPHPTDPYNKVGVPLGEAQLAADHAWRDRGLLALVGMGVEPGLSDVFARYAADVLFDTIDERLRLRTHLLDLDDHRRVPQSAARLGEATRALHHRLFQRARDLPLPGRYRSDRMRERRARRSSAHPA